MNSLWGRIGLLLMLSLVVVTGVRSTAGSAEKEITVGYLVADLHGSPFIVMKEKKLLEAEGLKVKWSEFLAGAYLMQHMASGEVDFGSVGITPALITRGQGVDVVMLASVNAEGSSLVAANSVKSFKDLQGKNIGTPGIGSIQDAMLTMLEDKHKIKVQHKSMKVSDMTLYLKKGEISGFIAWEPFPSRAVDEGLAHVLASSHDIIPEHQCCVVITRGELRKKDPETIRKVMRAYMKALAFMKKNPGEVVEIMARVTGSSKKVTAAAMQNVQYPNPPYVNVPSLKLMAEDLIKEGKIPQGAVGDVNKFVDAVYDPSFLKEYLSGKKGK